MIPENKRLIGKPISKLIRDYIKDTIKDQPIKPRMILIQVAGDAASSYYVQSIIRTAGKLGIDLDMKELPAKTSQEELLALIGAANIDDSIHGIMVQEPFPSHIDANAIGCAINPLKDMDSLNPANLGRLMLDINGLTPCTPTAVYTMLKYYGIETKGRHIVIIGRSAVVGKPLANMLLWKKPFADATVSVVHSRSLQLKELTRQADIVVAALGRAGFVTADMIKENAILIDVGINEVIDEEGKQGYVGDIDYNSCIDKSLAISPVPGGVGIVTSSVLFLNLLRAYMGIDQDNKSIDGFLSLIFDDTHKK
ncbi:MAG: bifunctional 5,10-methylenetetrahydrofolate dehydrogenase/5,10-methenyltetrahydrofolate cyclohydrolase [Candidatus Cloacimonetes bacterium]|nr:bifunctional 5,10-methylenetetrahydrofolate dehydrogenase/5,10-methenyltetrahydrofolate cyclohydrolase [Candidatus Cloacimonadota bacterium]NLO12000.1 bifunctional 5,10-methylenetetrahydrofolate dehydrogenase/5,10-methenyltetrahydrofolate cyclohydrolase [Candidatus Cloacimonadota bacterium]